MRDAPVRGGKVMEGNWKERGHPGVQMRVDSSQKWSAG